MNEKIKQLLAGNYIHSKEPGNSMIPLIRSREQVLLAPVHSWEQIEVGDIVYCKVRGRIYTHLVTSKNIKRGLQISNNHGHVNGWTKTVFGKVIEINGVPFRGGTTNVV